MSKIATLDQALASTAKLLRLLREAGLPEDALKWPVDDPEFREKLVVFWRNYGEEVLKNRRDVIVPSIFKSSDTGLNFWLERAEGFASKCFGMTVNLREMFDIPSELPWKSVIPVFDPGNLTNRDAVTMALKSQGIEVYEETDVMKYKGSGAHNVPTLHFIENSLSPNNGTMGKSPNWLRKTGNPYLRLRGYTLAFGLCKVTASTYLDSETFTWFPEDRPSDGGVARGDWNPNYRRAGFIWSDPDYEDGSSGARVAIEVPQREK